MSRDDTPALAVVVDASAVLAFLNGEVGADEVEQVLLQGARMSTVNFAEVVTKLHARDMSPADIRPVLQVLGLVLEPFDDALAYLTGALYPLTKLHGLSLADRVCLALAQRDGCRVLTADRAWREVADAVGVTVVLVR